MFRTLLYCLDITINNICWILVLSKSTRGLNLAAEAGEVVINRMYQDDAMIVRYRFSVLQSSQAHIDLTLRRAILHLEICLNIWTKRSFSLEINLCARESLKSYSRDKLLCVYAANDTVYGTNLLQLTVSPSIFEVHIFVDLETYQMMTC